VFPILRSLKFTWSAKFSDTNASPISFCGGSGQPVCANQARTYPVQVRWGTPVSGSGQSGLGFNAANGQTVDSATPFSTGTLTHINFPVTLNVVETTAKLTITAVLTASDGTVLFNQAIPVTLGIDETTNTAPCIYPSITPCADAITIQNIAGLTATNTVEGTTYRFSILGFRKNTTDTTNVTQLISDEGRTNSVLLVAQFDVVG
jgi:hypothetical protein